MLNNDFLILGLLQVWTLKEIGQKFEFSFKMTRDIVQQTDFLGIISTPEGSPEHFYSKKCFERRFERNHK